MFRLNVEWCSYAIGQKRHRNPVGVKGVDLNDEFFLSIFTAFCIALL